jgi:hypothetical protein
MNILYCPIFEGGSAHATAVANKRGLYTALAKAGHRVTEYDYQARPRSMWIHDWNALAEIMGCDLVISQFHGSDETVVADVQAFRQKWPNARWCNWSGDSWTHSLTSPQMLDLCRVIDLQLVAAPDSLPIYAANGIRAEYWNIAYEPPVRPLPEVPHYDVVFLANVINSKRYDLMERLRSLEGISVGIYGDYARADGHCVYDFAYGEALYKRATLAIADNVYDEQQRYISNRPMQCMAAGGALLLHQHVDKLFEMTGWVEREHYIEWRTVDELVDLIPACLNDVSGKREDIVEAAQWQVLTYHTFEARVSQLMDWLKE